MGEVGRIDKVGEEEDRRCYHGLEGCHVREHQRNKKQQRTATQTQKVNERRKQIAIARRFSPVHRFGADVLLAERWRRNRHGNGLPRVDNYLVAEQGAFISVNIR